MKYRIEISSVAEAEADGAFLRISQITSPQSANQWYAGLLKAIENGDRSKAKIQTLPHSNHYLE